MLEERCRILPNYFGPRCLFSTVRLYSLSFQVLFILASNTMYNGHKPTVVRLGLAIRLSGGVSSCSSLGWSAGWPRVLGGGREGRILDDVMNEWLSGVIDTIYAIAPCEYSNYVALLHCNQFYRGGVTGEGQSSYRGGAWPSLPPHRTATVCNSLGLGLERSGSWKSKCLLYVCSREQADSWKRRWAGESAAPDRPAAGRHFRQPQEERL